MICLTKEKIAEFRKALKEKMIKLEDLLNMSTEVRTALLEKYAGANAKDVNLLFEQKLVLKNKLQGIKNAISKLGEIGRYDPAKKTQIAESLKEFMEKQTERIFNPQEGESFYNALADKVLGTHITRDEAKQVFKLTSESRDFKAKEYSPDKEMWSDQKIVDVPSEKWMEYGLKQRATENYIESLKGKDASIKSLLKGRYNEFKSLFKEDKLQAAYGLLSDVVNGINRATISVVASIDDSFLGRQGHKTLLKSPKLWADMAKKSFIDIKDTLRGKGGNVSDLTWAEVYGDPHYIEGRYDLMKILPRAEEQFPTSLPGRIPVAGRVFEAAENAFVNSAIRTRTGLARLLLKIQKGNGVNINDYAILKNTGKFINSASARGQWGRIGSSPIVNLAIWAPKMLKSAVDTLAMPFYPGINKFTRIEAAKLLLKFIASVVIIKSISSALSPGSVENDPRSTDFKNLKFGNTRFQLPGIGELSLITLASRIIPTMHNGKWGWWYKKSDGTFMELGKEYGQPTPWDVAIQFFENKSTPLARTFVNVLNGKTISGARPDWANQTTSLITPISIQNAIQLKDDASTAAVLGVIADVFGFNANTYPIFEDDWSQKSSKEMTQFKENAGEEEFNNANDEYNQRVINTINSEKYKNMSSEEKDTYLTKQKDLIKKDIFKKHGFKPKN